MEDGGTRDKKCSFRSLPVYMLLFCCSDKPHDQGSLDKKELTELGFQRDKNLSQQEDITGKDRHGSRHGKLRDHIPNSNHEAEREPQVG